LPSPVPETCLCLSFQSALGTWQLTAAANFTSWWQHQDMLYDVKLLRTISWFNSVCRCYDMC